MVLGGVSSQKQKGDTLTYSQSYLVVNHRKEKLCNKIKKRGKLYSC